MFCKATNSNIPVVVDILAVSADRPERSALNFMLGHNGISSKRWRYSAYINVTKTKSCLHCMIRRINALRINVATYYVETQKCCCDWDFDSDEMKSDLPTDYPRREHPMSPSPPAGREVEGIQYLYPIELTYEILIKGVQFCFSTVITTCGQNLLQWCILSR